MSIAINLDDITGVLLVGSDEWFYVKPGTAYIDAFEYVWDERRGDHEVDGIYQAPEGDSRGLSWEEFIPPRLVREPALMACQLNKVLAIRMKKV